MDPGHSLHLGNTSVLEEEEDEEELAKDAGLAGQTGSPRASEERSRQRALQILQKTRSNVEEDAL
jgi:hypothetical protein